MKHSSLNFINKTIVFTITLLLVAIAINMFFTPQNHIADALNATTSKEIRKLDFIDQNIAGMNYEYDTATTRNRTKTAYDFAGNSYTIIECTPIGYMIMCDASATMVEYSGTSPSPYSNYDSALYYVGPTFYYAYIDGKYLHTITGDELVVETSNSKSTLSNLATISTELHNEITANSNTAALNYINNGIQSRIEVIQLYNLQWRMVNNSAFFSTKMNQTQMGYLAGGYCGYIAANLLVGYYDTFVKECMNDNYMSGSGINRHFTGSGLTQEIFSYSNGNNSSTSTTIRQAMNKYFKAHNYDVGSYDMITPFFNGTTLKNLIENNTPSILFGDLGNATTPSNQNGPEGGNHAVVIYGYKDGGVTGTLYSFMAHFGWSGYSQSTINCFSYSVFGSMYRITT